MFPLLTRDGDSFCERRKCCRSEKTNDARTIWTNDINERLGSFSEINYRTNDLIERTLFTKQTILLKERFY